MSTHVALLRGINVGGNHKLPMAQVRQVLDAAGLGPTRTYIQSGNVLLEGTGPDDELAAQVGRLLEEAAGFAVPTVVLGADELRAMVAANPFSPAAPKLEHVVVLPAAPDAGTVAWLEQLRDELGDTDDLAIGTRCVYLSHPDGLLQSKLAARATALLRDGTARNLATMTKLVELLG